MQLRIWKKCLSFGFTEDEVKELCIEYDMSFEEVKAWYDGYRLISHSRFGDKTYSIYSPKSVVEAMLRHKFGTYGNQTEAYEALKVYIQMNMDELKNFCGIRMRKRWQERVKSYIMKFQFCSIIMKIR